MTAIFQDDDEQILLDRRNAAFTGWQFYTHLKSTGLLGSAPLVKYSDYLGNLGLLKEDEVQALQTYKKMKRFENKAQAANNIAEAQAIVDSLRRQKEDAAKT